MLTESVISLELGDLVLRPLDEEKDMDLLFQWRNDLTYLALWMPQRYPVSKEEFKAEFERFQRTIEHIRLIIIKDGKTVGTVYSYNCNLTHGWVYIATYLRPEFRKKGIGPKAWALFVEYLFDNFPFRKVYCDVYGFNNLSLSTLKSGSLEVQAQLPKHIFWQGLYYDMYIMALTRENLGIIKSHLSGWRARAARKQPQVADAYTEGYIKGYMNVEDAYVKGWKAGRECVEDQKAGEGEKERSFFGGSSRKWD